MIHRFFRHIREGFVGFKRHLGMSLSSASAVTLTLLLVGLFMILSANLTSLSKEIESSISLVCLVDYEVETQDEINRIQKEINDIIGVISIEYRTKDQEFEYYQSSVDEESAEFFENYRDDNPFHDAFLVQVLDGEIIGNVKIQIQNIKGIDSVEDGGETTYLLIDLLQGVRFAGGILVIALCFLAVYLIFNTIKITIDSRQDEIFIMRNVGAFNGYIRAPFLVEGIIIAVLGAIIPVLVLCAGYYYLYDYTGGILLAVIRLIEPIPFLLYLALALLGVGVLVGFIGSYISVSKNLRLRR